MFKRTRGYFLLTMLVLTGLAGRLHTDILSAKERRYLSNELKNSESAFEKSIKGLSVKQLNFRSGKNQPNIQECIFHLGSVETFLWNTSKDMLRKPAAANESGNADDECVPVILTSQSKTPEQLLQIKMMKFNSVNEAEKKFINERKELLRYVKTTTQNAKAHFIETRFGCFDAYQLMLMNAVYTNYVVKQIQKIKSGPHFPR